MHTYLRMDEERRYDVGQWLRNREGYDSFVALFSVETIDQAFAAVNMLNGGATSSKWDLGVKEKE